MNCHKCIWWYHYTCTKTLGLIKSVQILFVLFYEKMGLDSVCKMVEIHMKFSTLLQREKRNKEMRMSAAAHVTSALRVNFKVKRPSSFCTDYSKAAPLLQFVHIFVSAVSNMAVTKIRLFKYIENFTTKKMKVSDKKKWYILHISAQNIDCGYALELPRQGGSNEYVYVFEQK